MCSIGNAGYHDLSRKGSPVVGKKQASYDSHVEKPKAVEEKPPPAVKKQPDIKKAIPGTISIKNSKAIAENNKAEETEEDKKNKPSGDFSQEQLETVWKNVAEKYKSDKNLFSTLTKQKPSKKENFVVEYVVDNKIQKKEIEERLIEFLPVFREKLNNYQIQVSIVVPEQPKNDKPYTPQEKFKKMAEKNPALQKLKDQLDLEIDF
jgi:DNA polymerase-3 subunit gamma/tau